MIWLTWRQFRTPLLVAAGLLAALAAGLVVLGLMMRSAYDGDVAGCAALNDCEQARRIFRNAYIAPVSLLSLLLFVVPALIGAFWGAPLITRELETGTHRLVWTQSVTRTRWLAVKLGIVAAVAVGATAVFSLLLTWAVKPFDDLTDSRFSALSFGSRNLAPLGYALFALLLGTTVGLLVRRTLPAMAITLAVFAVVQVAVPFVVRAHLLPPVEKQVAVTAAALEDITGLGMTGEPPGPDGKQDPGTKVVADGYQVPDAWMLSGPHQFFESDGRPLSTEKAEECFTGPIGAAEDCLAKLNLHFDVVYQPGSRYWPFQALETTAYAVLAALLAAFCLRRIPRGVA